jgi:hypothetical protein
VELFSSWLLSEKDGAAAGFRLAFPQFFSESSGTKFMPTVCTNRLRFTVGYFTIEYLQRAQHFGRFVLFWFLE